MDQLRHTSEAPKPHPFFRQFPEPALHQIQPGRARRREVQHEPLVLFQPCFYLGLAVGPIFVHDQMQRHLFGELAVQLPQEALELLVPVFGHALADNPSVQWVETLRGPCLSRCIAMATCSGRLLFVDDIRVFLTILVLLHHSMIIHSGTGGWIWSEGRQDVVTNALGGWFCATNQSYFMGLFLLISAYFVPGSYDRKDGFRFFKDRLIRLGIPLAVYSWIINPLFVYVALYRDRMSFWRFFPSEYFSGGELIGQGPMWFVEVLLIFSLVYVAWRFLIRPRTANRAGQARFPGSWTIAVFALLLGVATFLVRLVFVMDVDRFVPLNLQLPFFVPYIALFIVGLVAYRRNWLLSMVDKTGRLWLRIAFALVLFWAPMMVFSGAIDGNIFQKGGWHWQSLVYALWESFLCVSACIGVIYLFRRYLNRRGMLAGFLVPNAYTAYLIHAPVITFLALGFNGATLYPLLKWAMLVVVAVPLCFVLSSLIRKLPYTNRIL
jgi:glucan biosynthesis protein C